MLLRPEVLCRMLQRIAPRTGSAREKRSYDALDKELRAIYPYK